MAAKPRARTEDEQVALMTRLLILAFDILGANPIEQVRIVRKLTDRAFADLEQQVQRRLAGERIQEPRVVSESAFRAGLRRGLFRIKPKRPTDRGNVLAMLEYERAKKAFDSAILELGLSRQTRRDSRCSKRTSTSASSLPPKKKSMSAR